MESFLKESAAHLLGRQLDLSKVKVVLPNRRAGLFFTQHLGRLVTEASWMPKVMTVEDLFYEQAGSRPTDQLTLIFELYKVYSSLRPNPESFDRFYYWGEMILRDFNDLDQFLADPKKLYLLVSQIKEIESDLSYLTDSQVQLIKQFWKSFEFETHGHQERFKDYWEILFSVYSKFRKAISDEGLAYSGMIYRQVVEDLAAMPKPEDHYIFIGFNAFTGTEEALIKHFVSKYKAEILWDMDAFYVDNPQYEAGMFFRDYRRDSVLGPTFRDLPERINHQATKIKVYQTPLKVNQANIISKVLEAIPPGEALEETVVILPDEQLLFSVMSQLPDNINKVNVTMGYPVRNAPIYAFLEAILELQRYVKVVDEELRFYHVPIRDLLSSGFIKAGKEEFIKSLLDNSQRKNQIYISQKDLVAGGELFAMIFRKLQTEELFGYMEELMKYMARELQEDALQRSYLYQCHKQLVRLKEVFGGQQMVTVSLDFFIRLFRQIFREVKLPFEGEPLAGLQVMGVLESRNLDFRRVIIANMNEGNFPPAAGLNSLIPYNIRKAFGLPVQEQNDGIYAYTFYRLLHRAEEIHMIYSTASDGGRVGEMSRYIRQLTTETPLKIDEEVVYVPVDLSETPSITIEKTDEILRLLENYTVNASGNANKSLSPSALSVYLDCRLKFYFKYIAKIKEKDKVEEEVSPSVFGNLAHYSLEYLYQGFVKRKQRKLIQPEDFKALEAFIAPSIELAIRAFYHLEDDQKLELTGQLAIVRDVLQKYIKQVLNWDKENSPFSLISLEKEHDYAANIPAEANGQHYMLSLSGIIDRVDEHLGTVRLIDYKSGQDTKSFPSIHSLFDREDKKRNKAAMQTMIYGLLYQSVHPQNSLPLKPAIFNFKEIFKDTFSPYLSLKEGRNLIDNVDDYRVYHEEFLSELSGLLSNLMDREQAFDQTEDLKKCEYCPYREICGR